MALTSFFSLAAKLATENAANAARPKAAADFLKFIKFEDPSRLETRGMHQKKCGQKRGPLRA